MFCTCPNESCECKDFFCEDTMKRLSDSFDTCITIQHQQNEKINHNHNQCHNNGRACKKNDEASLSLNQQGLQAAVQAAVAAESEIYALKHAIADLENMLQKTDDEHDHFCRHQRERDGRIINRRGILSRKFPILTDVDHDHDHDERGVVSQIIPCDEDEVDK